MNKKILLLLAASAAFLAVFVWMQFRFEERPDVDLLSELEREVLDDESQQNDFILPSIPGPESFVDGEYQDGYKIGYMAFKLQNGSGDVPVPMEIKYASYEGEDANNVSEDYNKGYVDGYHKATEMVGCVSGGCPY